MWPVTDIKYLEMSMSMFVVIVVQVKNKSSTSEYLQRCFVGDIDIPRHNSFGLEVVLDAVLAPFATHARMLDAAKSVVIVRLCPSSL